jgi:hypothetical protein
MDGSFIPKCLGGSSEKDDEYWRGGFAAGVRHSSHVAMDEYLEHYSRLNGVPRVIRRIAGSVVQPTYTPTAITRLQGPVTGGRHQ